MGVPAEAADRVLRFSAGWDTTAEDWAALGAGIRRAYEVLTQRSVLTQALTAAAGPTQPGAGEGGN
jgi:cysteine sulfinate desulfinase/cysteine desulfurase-like protein